MIEEDLSPVARVKQPCTAPVMGAPIMTHNPSQNGTGLPGGDVSAVIDGLKSSVGPSLETMDVTDSEGSEPCGPPDPAEQARIVNEFEQNAEVNEGHTMYLISCKWYGAWRQYTGQQQDGNSTATEQSQPPGPIDNRDIVDVCSNLRPLLKEGQHFVILCRDSWDSLRRWYGSETEIARTAVMEGLATNSKRPRVMVYPMNLDVWYSDKEVKTMQADKAWTTGKLKQAACALFGVKEEEVDLWDYFKQDKHALLEGDKLAKGLDDNQLLDSQAILLDIKASPLAAKHGTSNSTPPALTWDASLSPTPARGRSTFHEDSVVQGGNPTPGLFGLQNLGNTCFMNSSLQCLMHTVPLLKVFLSHAYQADINTVNPLGMKGELASGFGNLMGMSWQGGIRTAVPRGFKATIAQFAPQFSGYQQHDSQEFLAFLLDGLHEDLNRIKNKPYVEEKDADGRSDAELAAEAWQNYRLRNDSAIVDHFQGLYKSTLVCPKCNYCSIKFDPFMYLSLPLPESRVRQVSVVLLTMDGSRLPVQYGLEVPQTGTLRDLYAVLCRAAGLHLEHPEQQLVAALLRSSTWDCDFEAFTDPKKRITELALNKGTLLVYQYATPAEGPCGEGNQEVRVFMRKVPGTGSRRTSPWAAPLLLWCPPSETYDPLVDVTDHTPGATSWPQKPFYEVGLGAPIWQQLRRALAPFRVGEAVWDEAAATAAAAQAAEAAAAAAQAQQPADMVEDVTAAPTTAAVGPDAEQAQHTQHATAAAATTPRDVTMGPGEGFGEAAGAAEGGVEPLGSASGGSWGSECGSGAAAAGGSMMDGVADLKDLEEFGANSNAAMSSADEDSCSFLPDMGACDMVDAAESLPPAAAAADGAGGDAVGVRSVAQEPDQQPATDAAVAAEGGPVPVAAFDMWAGQAHTLAAAADGDADAAAADAAAKPADAAKAAGLAALARNNQQQAAAAGSSSFVNWGAGSTAAAAAAEEGGEAAPAAPYVLYLADDRGQAEWSTLAAKRYHPNSHHSDFVLDWHLKAAEEVCEVCRGLEATRAAIAAGLCHLHHHHSQGGSQQQQHQQHEAGAPAAGASGSGAACCPPPAAAAAAPAAEDGVVDVPPPGEPWQLTTLGGYALQLLEAPLKHTSAVALEQRLNGPSRPVSLSQCVDAFLQPEQLSADDEWYCPKCKEFVQADKKLDLWSLPEVLVIHLKRFRYTRYNREKLDTPVVFPLQGLDLGSFLLAAQQQYQQHQQQQQPDSSQQQQPQQQPEAAAGRGPNQQQQQPSSSERRSSDGSGNSTVYDCFAVSNHFGGLGGGHYTAFAQLPETNSWYCFDDSRVEPSTPEQVQSPAAYVLFYRRRQESSRDPPKLVEGLLQQHKQAEAAELQQQEEGATAAAAAAAAGVGAAGAVAGGGDVEMVDAAHGPQPPSPVQQEQGQQHPTAAAAQLGPSTLGDDVQQRAAQHARRRGSDQDVVVDTAAAAGNQSVGVAWPHLSQEGVASPVDGAGMSGLVATLPSPGATGAAVAGLGLGTAGEEAGLATSSCSSHGQGAAPADSSSSGGSSRQQAGLAGSQGRRGSGTLFKASQQQQQQQQHELHDANDAMV